MRSRIKDEGLADEGKKRVEWAGRQMKVLGRIRDRFSKERPLEGVRVAACLHVTSEAANFALALQEGGAEVALAASNPLSTQDSVAAYLVSQGVSVFAVRGDSEEEYHGNLEKALEIGPNFTVDDGGDLTVAAHKRPELLKDIFGGAEETTTGVVRLENMARDGALEYPVMAVNDSKTKQMFDNRYGTGQSALDGIIRATNVLVAGKTFVVAGYGWCGKGVARRADGMGADVVVTEVDPVRALEARMDGYRVMPMARAAEEGDIFVTVTGDRDVITVEDMRRMKDGAVLANSGHFDVEVDVQGLREAASASRRVRESVEEFRLGGRRLYLLAEGRLVNLAAAEGHPASVMDLSFANQALACELMRDRGLEPGVHRLPAEIDRRVAAMKLDTMGVEIDRLTRRQKEYTGSWEEGT